MNVTEKLLLWGYVSAKASDLRVASSEQMSSKSNTCIEKKTNVVGKIPNRYHPHIE